MERKLTNEIQINDEITIEISKEVGSVGEEYSVSISKLHIPDKTLGLATGVGLVNLSMGDFQKICATVKDNLEKLELTNI